MSLFNRYKSSVEYLKNVFNYHPPKQDLAATYQEVRAGGESFATTILLKAPDGYERDEALKSVEMAVMWANAAIARS